ncbi:hypothetical protein VP01_951g2 [Puccinia sorghi]|uniref:Uncharacterized protein n=1 Tax=Puccinia sorghi TaxID=27349 RepID=A0A0L6U6W8_9BASI|nr:hypothetical protein VP01_951g2 [Puccinia sorghi]
MRNSEVTLKREKYYKWNFYGKWSDEDDKNKENEKISKRKNKREALYEDEELDSLFSFILFFFFSFLFIYISFHHFFQYHHAKLYVKTFQLKGRESQILFQHTPLFLMYVLRFSFHFSVLILTLANHPTLQAKILTSSVSHFYLSLFPDCIIWFQILPNLCLLFVMGSAFIPLRLCLMLQYLIPTCLAPQNYPSLLLAQIPWMKKFSNNVSAEWVYTTNTNILSPQGITVTKCTQSNLKNPYESQYKLTSDPSEKNPHHMPPHANSNLKNYHSCTTFLTGNLVKDITLGKKMDKKPQAKWDLTQVYIHIIYYIIHHMVHIAGEISIYPLTRDVFLSSFDILYNSDTNISEIECCDYVLTVVLRAEILPCHHNIQPHVTVTGQQLQACGSLGRFKDRLGGEWKQHWLIFGGVKRENWLAEEICLAFQALACVFMGGCLTRQLTQTKDLFLIQLSHCSNIMNCTEKVWLAKRFSGLIEPMDAEWCLVDYFFHISNGCGLKN